jgi:hypothetical protein
MFHNFMYCYRTVQNVPQLDDLPYVGKGFSISCWHLSVSCIVNHRVTYSSTTQSYLNLRQLRFGFDAGYRWLSLGYEFPWCNCNEVTFLISHVRLRVTRSRLRWVYLSDYNPMRYMFKVCDRNGHAVAQLVKVLATSRKVTGSIPDV